ncbi:hypothetical protein [Winogradskyella sp. PC D3.3]
MFAIFKAHSLPKLNTASLEASEAKALLLILELIDATDSEAYKNAKNSSTTQSTSAAFTENLAQHLYNHPKIYANEQQGLEFIASWLPLLKAGFYPDKQSTNKLVDFLNFSLGYMSSKDLSETLINKVFEVIYILVHSASAASFPVAHFLIHRALDIRDYLSSDFLIQQCLEHSILVGNYTIVNSDNVSIDFPFKINTDFVEHFYTGNWQQLTTDLHHILPVGRIYNTSAYELITPWLSSDLANFYKAHIELAFAAHQAIKDRLIFQEAKSLELLNIKTADNFYPLIAALGSKVWDAGDVLIFSHRDKTIPHLQVDACYLRFLDWLSVDGGSNFYSEAFQDYGKSILSNNTARALPVQYIPFWFQKCHPKSGIKNQMDLYNRLFSNLLIQTEHNQLPLMRFEHKDLQLTGDFLLTKVFQIDENFKTWLEGLQKEGIKNPLNQFLLLTLYDARKSLLNLYNEAQQEVLHIYAIAMAYSASQASEAIRKQQLPLIVKILTTLCVDAGNFMRVNEIWALKHIDHCIVDLCNNFAKHHYITDTTPLHLNRVQSWYNFLSDYYYSATTEAVWVSEMLETQGQRTAIFFNRIEDDITYVINDTINRLLHFHKKSKQCLTNQAVFNGLSTQIETYLTDLLQELDKDKLGEHTIRYLHEYSKNETYGFQNKTALINAINGYYDFHSAQESITETNALIEQLNSPQIEIENVQIDRKFVEIIVHNLEHYKTEGTCDIQLLKVLDYRIKDFKIWLLCDETGLESRFSQALYMTLLDTDLAPGTTLETFGTLCRSLFVQLTKGSKLASSYAMGLKAMTKSGAYPEDLTNVLRQVIDDLNA